MTESQWLDARDPLAMLGALEAFGNVSARKMLLVAAALYRQVAGRPCLSRDLPAIITGYEAWAEMGEMPAAMAALFDGEVFRDACDNAREAVVWCYRHIEDDDLLWFTREQGRRIADIVGNPFRSPSVPADWLTRDVTATARAASDAAVRWCDACDGAGSYERDLAGDAYEEVDCEACRGSGRVPGGILDGAALAVLSDALEEAGCPGAQDVTCRYCHGDQAYSRYRVEATSAAGSSDDFFLYCGGCAGLGRVRLPAHPVLQALRSPGPHYLGFWPLDLILGKS